MQHPDLWPRVRAILEDVLDRPAAERLARVEEVCEGDADLREQVLRLLEEDAPDEDGYMQPPEGGALFPSAERETAVSGRRIGPWELRRELGSGGMGSVYLAVRADGQFRRQVAVKLIKQGLDQEEVVARFRRERQVQANLDHPGIARMLDGGVTDDGRPYLVMEYVEGSPIDRDCDERRLSTRERLELFCQICDAVHHAHKGLVVHRDLKPSNILVTTEGTPKLLDFGIAKVLDPEKASAEALVTREVMSLMTPSYASPEQVRGRPITTASDVYSLGVILYQLLSGHLPHQIETSTPAEIERIVCEERPPRPSTVVTRVREYRTGGRTGATTRVTPEDVSERRETTPRLLRRTLTGDLDRIVLMAMRKEPQRRYASAAQLAEDLRRYLAGLPVIARPDTLLYRSTRFVQRNKLGVAAGLVTFLSLVGGLVLATRARSNEREQRQLAEARALELERLSEAIGREKRVAVERADELQHLAEELQREKTIADERLQDVRALSTTLVFDLARRVVPLEGAAPAVAVLCDTGVQYLEKLAGEAGDDPSFLRQLSDAYCRLGQIQGSSIIASLGRTDDALVSLRKAVEVADRARDLDPDDARNAYVQVSALTQLADVLESLRRPEEAQECYLGALAAAELIAAAPEPKLGHMYVWCGTLDQYGELLESLGHDERAAEQYGRSRELIEQMLANWPRHHAVRSAAALSEARLGALDIRLGRPALAVERLERAVVEQQALVEEFPTNAGHRRTVWSYRLSLARAYEALDRTEHALALLSSVREAREASYSSAAPGAQAAEDLMYALDRFSETALGAGRTQQALDAGRRQEALAREALAGEEDSRAKREALAMALVRTAEAERRLGRLEVARAEAEEALALARSAGEGEDPQRLQRQILGGAYTTLGRVHLATGEDGALPPDDRFTALEEARACFDQVLALSAEGARYDDFREQVEEDARRCTEALGALQR